MKQQNEITHLPSLEDSKRWKAGARVKNLKWEKMVKATIERFNRHSKQY